MDRRSLLSSIVAVAAGGLAGCTVDEAGGNDEISPDENGTGADGGGSSDGNETGTDEGSQTATPGPATLGEASLTVTDSGCGQQTDAAEVAFEEQAVVVTGTIWGSDACKVPELAEANYDAQADELTVTIGTTERSSDEEEACAQCISELDYRVTASFDGGLPGSVSVAHVHDDEREEVTTASPS